LGAIVLDVFAASCSRRGDNGRDDRRFLKALHFFTVHNIAWRALPVEHGACNSVWKRFKRIAARRCGKTARNYGSFVALAPAFVLVKSAHGI
jgi:hypothetical protein